MINNGFARTEVTQTFYNPNPATSKACTPSPSPSPRQPLRGDDLRRWASARSTARWSRWSEAERIYEEEKSQGNDAGLASKNGYQSFEFRVSPIPRAGRDAHALRLLPAPSRSTPVSGATSTRSKTAAPTRSPRASGSRTEGGGHASHDRARAEDPPGPSPTCGSRASRARRWWSSWARGTTGCSLERQGAQLDRDFVFYYRLAGGPAGRVELIPYRPDPSRARHLHDGGDAQASTCSRSPAAPTTCSCSTSREAWPARSRTLGRGVSQALGELDPEGPLPHRHLQHQRPRRS